MPVAASHPPCFDNQNSTDMAYLLGQVKGVISQVGKTTGEKFMCSEVAAGTKQRRPLGSHCCSVDSSWTDGPSQGRWDAVIVYGVVGEGFCEEVLFEWSPKGPEAASRSGWQAGTSKCKGPEALKENRGNPRAHVEREWHRSEVLFRV